MDYKEICIQADLALRDLNNLRHKYEVVFYVGRNEWGTLCDKYKSIGDESIPKSEARFYGCPVRIMDTNNYFGVGLEIEKD